LLIRPGCRSTTRWRGWPRQRPALFDFHYLRFEGQRYGQQALEQLAQQSSGPEAPWIREQASKALKEVQPWTAARPGTLVSVRVNLTLWPQGAPAGQLCRPALAGT
jgi:hypothetical protein